MPSTSSQHKTSFTIEETCTSLLVNRILERVSRAYFPRITIHDDEGLLSWLRTVGGPGACTQDLHNTYNSIGHRESFGMSETFVNMLEVPFSKLVVYAGERM